MNTLVKIAVSAAVIFLAYKAAKYDDVIPPLATKLNSSYDYIIVGGGTAGCILANRLSEDGDVSVLLLEAGGDDRGEKGVVVPSAAPSLLRSHLDWDYGTVPREGQEIYLDKRMPYNAGRVLGGSSSINFLAYVRGHRHDYDQWASSGCRDWDYENVLRYFHRLENVQDDPDIDSSQYGHDGPVRVEVSRTGTRLKDVLVQAARELNLNYTDYNLDGKEGYSFVQHTAFKGERSSTSQAYLRPVLTRPNLHVAVNAFVTKVVFDGRRAVGVEAILRGRNHVIRAGREVVLSAGALGSPRLLLQSGVGPRQHLEALKIPVVADLPVGENFHNHVLYDYQIAFKQPVGLSRDQLTSWWSKLQFQLLGTGPLSSMGGDVCLWVSTSQASRRGQWPDVQVILINTVWDSHVLQAIGLDTEVRMAVPSFVLQVAKQFSARDNVTHGLVCLPVLQRPRSRGTVRLTSPDPFDDLDIDPRFLTHPDDLEILVKGVSVCQKLLKTPSMQAEGAEPADVTDSTCTGGGAYDTSHPEYWRCHVARMARGLYHYSGTCKMGASADPTAVVDPALRVRGVDGLRVVDASIFPAIPSGNIAAAVMMTAEKAADVIKLARHSGR